MCLAIFFCFSLFANKPYFFYFLFLAPQFKCQILQTVWITEIRSFYLYPSFYEVSHLAPVLAVHNLHAC